MITGDVVGAKYKIIRVIGIRGTKKRYVGESLDSKDKVIIETLHESLASDQKVINEIAYEVQLASKLNGPYFKEFIESISQDGKVLLIWKYNDAQPLSRNPSLQTLTSRDICRFISTTIRALILAHNKGVIHGALSTDVILITPQLEPVIIGFSVPGVEPITDPGIENGLSAYAACAPELFKGEPIDESCDFYAVGKIAQFLFSLVESSLLSESQGSKTIGQFKEAESPEISRARSLILGLNSTIRSYRNETALKIADQSFLDEMATPPGGTQTIKVSRRQSRRIKKQLRPRRAPINEHTRFLIAITIKVVGIVGAAIGVIVIVAKLTQQN